MDFRKGGEIVSSVLYINIISVLMCVYMKSVAKQPENLCIINVIYWFVYVRTSFPQGGAYFPVEHL